jgi:hypothetical protein
MDHLSSCYFCGTAMDRPLQSYRVVPVELRDDDAATTATLCGSCHTKLERVLGPVAETVGVDSVTLDIDVDGTRGPDTSDRDARGTTPAAQRDGEAGRDGATERDTAADSSGTDATGDDRRTVDTSAEAAPGDGDQADPAPDDDPDGIGADLVEVDGFEDPLAPAGGGEDPDADGESAASGGQDAGDDVAGNDGTDAGDDADGASDQKAGASEDTDGTGVDAGVDDESGDGSATARTTVTALEYNKVMRLLQNREFPVDREEIEVVAANAYGLAQQECGAVIDLAVDRGLVDERDGKLVRPE